MVVFCHQYAEQFGGSSSARSALRGSLRIRLSTALMLLNRKYGRMRACSACKRASISAGDSALLRRRKYCNKGADQRRRVNQSAQQSFAMLQVELAGPVADIPAQTPPSRYQHRHYATAVGQGCQPGRYGNTAAPAARTA